MPSFQIGDRVQIRHGSRYISSREHLGNGTPRDVGVITYSAGPGHYSVRFDTWDMPTDGAGYGWSFSPGDLEMVEPATPRPFRVGDRVRVRRSTSADLGYGSIASRAQVYTPGIVESVDGQGYIHARFPEWDRPVASTGRPWMWAAEDLEHVEYDTATPQAPTPELDPTDRCAYIDAWGRVQRAQRPRLPEDRAEADRYVAEAQTAYDAINTCETRTALLRALADRRIVTNAGTDYSGLLREFVSAVGSRMSSRRYVYGSMQGDSIRVAFCSPSCFQRWGLGDARSYDRGDGYQNTMHDIYNSQNWEVMDRQDPRVQEFGHRSDGTCRTCRRTIGIAPSEPSRHRDCVRCGTMDYCENPTEGVYRCRSCEEHVAAAQGEMEALCYGCGYRSGHAPTDTCDGTVDDLDDVIAALLDSSEPVTAMAATAPDAEPRSRSRGAALAAWEHALLYGTTTTIRSGGIQSTIAT